MSNIIENVSFYADYANYLLMSINSKKLSTRVYEPISYLITTFQELSMAIENVDALMSCIKLKRNQWNTYLLILLQFHQFVSTEFTDISLRTIVGRD